MNFTPAELAADGALRSRITDEGKLRFAPQVRIRTEVDDSLEARFEALAEREQAQLEADAALGKAKTVIQEPGD